ncbi:MAG: asparagine--tRNA ligase [Firmicutes bacterium]|nr:asparagine--tRNA ligase [Bacillota bacterium]
MKQTWISTLKDHAGETVEVRGWLYNKRSSGKIHFLIVRDGTGLMQAVAPLGSTPGDVFAACGNLTQESSIIVRGVIREEKRAPGGYEMELKEIDVVQIAEEYPITLKEHGVDFLMDNRHLWIRTPRQQAILRIRAEIIRSIREYLDGNHFTHVDTPILTPAACEGTTTLFETNYFEQKAYLSQSGQLYNEASIAAFGRVYCFSPAFRAEKSKTRRHLIEFWVVEPEAAYCDFEENMEIQEGLVTHIVKNVLKNRRTELEQIGRNVEPLTKVEPPFPRLTYDEVVERLQAAGHEITWGQDLGAPDETTISNMFEKPVFVTHFPAEFKAFYMEPVPGRPELVLGADLLAPEGYGEIIGGGQRISDLALLERRMKEHNLPEESYRWYADLRRYGTVPHSGFGLGVERTVAWVCGLEHVREAIAFPRLLYRVYP